MAQHEPVDPLSEFDALLMQELSVTPSREFLPRVRERIRLEPARSRWSLVAPLVAAAVIVLGIGLWFWNGADDPVSLSSPIVSTVSPSPVEPSARLSSPEPRVPGPEPPVPSLQPRVPTFALRGTVGKPKPEYRTPDVLVDQRQRAALVSMLRLINQGQLTEDSFKTTTPAPAEIGVEPVALSPIVVGGVLPSESDRK
jgi:hypothetical protein